jgi:hypothetical protein
MLPIDSGSKSHTLFDGQHKEAHQAMTRIKTSEKRYKQQEDKPHYEKMRNRPQTSGGNRRSKEGMKG